MQFYLGCCTKSINNATFNLIKSFLFALLCSQSSVAASFMSEAFIDPTDGQLDMSNWLLEKKGFLPTPIIITEPAVGYGGGLALVYFHDKFGGAKSKPSVSVVAAGGTENGTWFVGGKHLGIWDDDNIRYVAAAGKADVNIEYYGLSDNIDKPSSNINLEANAAFFLQEIQFRLAESNFFAGLSYTFIDSDSDFQVSLNQLPIELPGVNFQSRSASISGILSYDSRDNIFTPNNGIASRLSLSSANSAWGSDEDYLHYDLSLLYYNDFAKNWVLGSRFAASGVDGDDAPYYAYPFVDLRGVKAMQFQGSLITEGELELRWTFIPRWTLVGFGGIAKAFNHDSFKNDSDIVYSKGAGIRYLIASKLGLQVGMDVAQGPDDTALYFQVGSAWAMK
ncbi:glyceraldehyde-3-phosphate dehydrogenase [Psychromonas sp. RZ22]|uniref:BamA/TamA family outer membrane protein n=1 Tax=Psychromonas algarum TaxID=2555643 RepID=UPI0010684EBA|nr:BamA/TamA family outer membrane protein [Psychromonas sp. RZ22]TEW53770.1 glyceraldehyde-3-phosphate dehydrogenase [Psychromonas sp. RZ22]